MAKAKGGKKRGKKAGTKHPIKHGILSYIQTGEFHPTQRKRKLLSLELERLRKLTIEQTEDMSIKKELLINDAIFCQGIMDLAMLYINKAGLFEEKALKRGQLEMQPIIRDLGRFMNTKRQNLMAVGLSSSADDVLTPFQLAEKIDREDEDEAKVKK